MDDLAPGTLLADRFRIDGLLGEGAFARTFRATDEQSGNAVALKVLWPSRMTSAGDIARFEREAAGLMRLSHPAIPRYVHHQELPGNEDTPPRYLLAQSFCPGSTLTGRIEAGQRLDEAAAITLLEQLLEVLAHLEEQTPPVVHRDLKPDNILVDDDGGVHLVDFGAVREAVHDTFNRGSTVVGTWGYMPPEQLIGQTLHASDLYAAGMVTLHALTRRSPDALLDGTFAVDLDSLSLGVSDGFRAVLAALVAPRVEDRYRSSAEVLADLEHVRSGREPRNAARIRPRPAQPAKLPRPTGWRVAALAGLLTLVPVGIVLMLRAGGISALPAAGAGMIYTLAALWTSSVVLASTDDPRSATADRPAFFSLLDLVGQLSSWSWRNRPDPASRQWISADTRQTVATVQLREKRGSAVSLTFTPHGYTKPVTYAVESDPRAHALFARKRARIVYPVHNPALWAVSAFSPEQRLVGVPEDEDQETVLLRDGRERIRRAREAARPIERDTSGRPVQPRGKGAERVSDVEAIQPARVGRRA